MPRWSSVKSLRAQCIRQVASTIYTDPFETPPPAPWLVLAKITKQKSFKMFEVLPADVLNDIMDSLKEMGPVGDQEIRYFLQPQLSQLDLSHNRMFNFPCQTLADRCQNMRKLVLCWNANLNHRALHTIISRMSKLVSLNVAGTGCSDQTLLTISISCIKIQDLDVSDCPKVTEQGIKYLCTSDHLGEEEEVVPCPNIIRLNILGCRVSKDGVVMAFQHLKHLQYLEQEWVWNILCNLHEDFDPGKEMSSEDVKKYKLRRIQFSGGYFPSDVMRAVQVMNNFCPEIIDVNIMGCGFDDQCLFRLSQHSPLKSLRIAGKNNMVTFRRGLQHYLKIKGQKLQALCLIDIPDINLACIADFCPLLESLTLICTQSLHATCADKNSIFRNLLRIEMRVTQVDVTEEGLEFLLSSCPAIQNIVLSDIQALTDSLLRTVLKKNQFRELQHLSLWRCNNISKEAILDLLQTTDMISSVFLKGCLGIFGTEEIEKYIEDHFYDVKIILSHER